MNILSTVSRFEQVTFMQGVDFQFHFLVTPPKSVALQCTYAGLIRFARCSPLNIKTLIWGRLESLGCLC